MNKVFLVISIVTTSYGLVNLFETVPAGFPNFPFPFQPETITWFDRTIGIDWAFDPITRAYRDPNWVIWSICLYFGASSLVALVIAKMMKSRLAKKID